MHVAIVAAPAHGHVNPLLPIAAELAGGGDRVSFVAGEEFAAAVRAAGAEPLPLGDLALPTGSGADPTDPAARDRMRAFLERARAALDAAVGAVAAARPDAVVYDSMLPMMGATAVLGLEAPRVAVYPTFAIPEGMTLREVMPRMPDGDGAAPIPIGDVPARAEGLNIVTIPRSYQPDGDAFDGRYLFVGPSLREEPEAAAFPLPAGGGPLAYVSLGTVASAKPAFYRAAFAALAARPWRATVATGRADPAALGPVPANVVARPHVPQLAVLRRADLFVTHGGMNSTMEALLLGVPLVVVPQMADQFLNARRVAALGLGRSLEGVEPTAAALLEAADAVLADPGYRVRAAALGREMAAAGGAARAATAIRAFAGAGLAVR